MSNRFTRWLGRLGPTLVLLAAAVFFIAPLVSSFRVAFHKVPTVLLDRHTWFQKWSFEGVRRAFDEPNFWPTLSLSLRLALITVLITMALLVPTALFVHLRLPKARALVEFFTLLPYVVPPIALVAGIAAFYRANARWFLNTDYALAPFYVVMAMPFTYRAIDAGIKAIDVRTLVDASRSLGGSWAMTLRKAILPNMATSLLSSAFPTATVVIGEFTIASTLAKNTFATFSFEYFGRDAQGGIGLALLTLIGTTGLLGILTLLTRTKSRRAMSTTSRF